MLDSTGITLVVTIPCIFCPKSVSIDTYTPTVGHNGEDLEGRKAYLQIVTTASEEALTLSSGRLYTVVDYDNQHGEVAYFNGYTLKPATLVFDGYAYSYGNPVMPKIGFGKSSVFWVCENCLRLLDDGAVSKMIKALRKKKCYHKIVDYIDYLYSKPARKNE